MRASDEIPYIDTTANFGWKLMIYKVVTNKIRTPDSTVTHLSLDEEKKVRFR